VVRRRLLILSAGFLIFASIVFVPLFSIWKDTFNIDISVRTQLDTVLSRLKEFRSAHGYYPETVLEIDSFFLEDGMKRTDRWGTPLSYKLVNGHVLLYSFGPNLEDDGGLGDDLLPTGANVNSQE